MDYKKITINITPFQEWIRDVLIAELGEIDYDSFVESETGFEAFIPFPKFNNKSLELLLDEHREGFNFEVLQEKIKDQNWNEVWEKNYFKPLTINKECVIRAPFHSEYPKAKYEIVIEPNMAFGTGNHETTSLVIKWILETELTRKTVLDMGCGTGILGILASMKGADKITAIDIDEWSFNGTRENATLNGISNIEIKLGDASLLSKQQFDIIFANIHKNVLINDLPKYNQVLKPGGILIMSGFYTEDIQDIEKNAENLELTSKGYKTENNWVAYSFQKTI